MNRYFRILLLMLIFPGAVLAAEWSSEVGFESRFFADTGSQEQSKTHPSLWFEAEYFKDWNKGRDSFTFSPFLVYDVRDDERTHWDIGELVWIHVGDSWELRTGVHTVFWGVVETQHQVDIINQTDLVMNVDEEDKLGQPMINLSVDQSWGTLDLYLMSFFRDRTFPGEEGRFRGPFIVDTDNPRFESSNERKQIDAAIRWHQYFGDFDIAISHFSGTDRTPSFEVQGEMVGSVFVPNGMLTPVYYVVDQTGLELQYIYEGWAFKLEAISNSGSGYGERYGAQTGGFEFTQTGIFESRIDLGWIVEYSHDSRDKQAPPRVLEHDLAIATRWILNDVDATEMLVGVVADDQTSDLVFFLEGSRRIGEYWKVFVEGRIYNAGSAPDSKLWYLEDDDFLKVELVRYF
ncbi:MAG: hypothetical protein KUG72_04340 [Pseudomonadales bacterium]|nr:hypothetical protein [Pseudomonadales bacterium]